MADMFISNSYKARLLNQAFGQSSSSEDYILDLFTNSLNIDDTTTAPDLTPGSWTGYAQVAVPRIALVAAVLSGNVAYIATSLVPLFGNSSGSTQSVYGWMLRGAVSGLLVCSQNFIGAPLSIPNGQTLPMYPFQIGGKSY